jgi:type IV pilus assembly protein PilX
MMQCKHSPQGRQGGAALILALIFLLLMTLLSTSAVRTSTMQERMAGNMRDWNLGFQGAEASLRQAEKYLMDNDVLPDFDNTGGFYQVNAPNRPVWVGESTSDGAGYITYSGAVQGASAPRYYIERLSSIRPAGTDTETGAPVEEIYYFRVTSVGYGGAVNENGSPVTAVVLSSVYRSR